MGDIADEIFEVGIGKIIGNSSTSAKDFFGGNNSFFDDSSSSSTVNPTNYVNDEDGCKSILYQELGSSHVRVWDFILLIPNLLFICFLASKHSGASQKLKGSNAPVFKAFYSLVWISSLVSLGRAIISILTSLFGGHYGDDNTDKFFWLLLRFCLLATEMSVIVFGVASGHLNSRDSIRRVMFVASFVSFAFSGTQALLEFQDPDPRFVIIHGNYKESLFGHGGIVFWLASSALLTFVYFAVLILPIVPIRTFLSLPQKRSFYYYVGFLFVLNLVQTIGAIMLYSDGEGAGLCIVNFTSYLYLTTFIPVVYFTFLGGFFKTAQPTLLFSYKAQVDDDEFHDSGMQFSTGCGGNGFVETPAVIEENPIVINGGGRAASRNSETTDMMAIASPDSIINANFPSTNNS